MRIIMRRHMNDGRQNFVSGQEYDVPNEKAINWIMEGHARKLTEPADPVTQPTERVNPELGTNPTLANAAPDTGNRRGRQQNNPGGLAVQAHGGFTTSDPSTKLQPLAGDRSPVAGPGAPENEPPADAIGQPQHDPKANSAAAAQAAAKNAAESADAAKKAADAAKK